MSNRFCVECGASLADADRFCTACGAAYHNNSVAQAAETDGLTENAAQVIDWPTEPGTIAAPHRRRRSRLPLYLGLGLLAIVAATGAVWFFLMRPDPVSSAAMEQQNLSALVTGLSQAPTLAAVSEQAATAAQRSDDLATYQYTNSEDDLRLQAMAAVYRSIAALQGISGADPSAWNATKEDLTGAINNALTFEPIILDQTAAEQMLGNINDLATDAEQKLVAYQRKRAAYEELNAIAYEFKRKRDALDPYFTESSTGSDMYYALQDKPAQWRDMQARLAAIDVRGAPGVESVRDDLDAALDRGASGIDDFLYAVPNSYDCGFKCWHRVWDSTAGQYSAQNDAFMKSLLHTRLPQLKKRITQSAPQ